MKYIAATLLLLGLAGCADDPKYIKDGATASDVNIQEAKCRMASREIAFSPREKEKGNELDSYVRELGQYQDCMTAAGYHQ